MKKIIFPLILSTLVSCGDKHLTVDRTKAGSAANIQTSSGDFAVTYSRDIKPIFEKTCSACHNEGSAIPNWGNYEVSFAKKDRLLDRVIIKKDMPLGFPMSDEERALVGEWLKLGAPEGGSAKTPPTQIAEPEPAPAPAPTPTPTPAIPPAPSEEDVLNYAKVKTAVFDQYCALCHNENSGDMMPNWSNPAIVDQRKDMIFKRVVIDKNMPPEDMPFSEEARDLIKKWIDGGAIQ